jgi:hypothetical protein
MAQEPEGQQPSLDELEAELTRLRSELDHYQELIEQAPAIYEEKFRHRVREVALDIRRLLDEEQDLQQQVAQALAGVPAPAGLPEAPAPPMAAASPEPAADRPRLPRLPRQRWLLFVGVAAAVALVTAILGTLLRGARQPAAPVAGPVAPRAEPASPATGSGEAPTAEAAGPPALRLRARGDCWLHVQTLEGDSLLLDTLQAGEERRLPLGAGLRLLAGRPDLLEVAVGENDYRTLGTITEIEWVTIRPPAGPAGPEGPS